MRLPDVCYLVEMVHYPEGVKASALGTCCYELQFVDNLVFSAIVGKAGVLDSELQSQVFPLTLRLAFVANLFID